MKQELTVLVQEFHENFVEKFMAMKKIHKKERAQLLERQNAMSWVYRRQTEPSASFSAPWDDQLSLCSLDEEELAESSV